MPFRCYSLMIFCLICILNAVAFADELTRFPWPRRYGPTNNSIATATDSIHLPTHWDEETDENIAWKVELPEFGHSTPIIGAGRIWLTCATADGTRQSVLCLDEESGQIVQKKLLFKNADPEPLGNKVNTYASPSCVLEPDGLYVHFGTYGTAKLDPETTEVLWQRTDIKCRHFRGPGSSPVLFKNLVILTFDGIDQQFTIALDKQTGKTVWRTDRSTDYDDLDADGKPRGDGDYRKAYNTPALVQVNGRTQVISIGARAVQAYDALTGKEIWTVTHKGYNAATHPMVYGDHVLLCTGGGRSNLISIDLHDNPQGNIDKTHVLWNREKGNSDLSSPILIGDRVFMVTGNGIIVCVNAKTGEEVWKSRVGGTFVSSPVSANGLIYFTNEEGLSVVIRAADTMEEVGRSTLSEGMRASPAIANGALFLRTSGHLYKIAHRSPTSAGK